MSSKLTVTFYIILCLEAGIMLTLLPWIHPFGLGDWGDNYFLLYASRKIGLQGLQQAVSSGWVRGAVTGLGLLNLGMAFWEMAHFRQTVQHLQAQEELQLQRDALGDGDRRSSSAPQAATIAPDADATPSNANHLSHHERRDD